MKIYLDACCLNRPFDDQTQDRIHLETEAILFIMMRFKAWSDWQWIGSEVLNFEIEQTPDPERRHRVALLAKDIHRSVIVEQREIERAIQLETMGFNSFDALHIACAESIKADIFLTTDDKLLNRANSLSKQLLIRIENPLTWLREIV
jgi:predicted nucleic acid-binding protein